MPFIIRGVSLLGIASAGTARDQREQVWERLAGPWKPAHLDAICTREATLELDYLTKRGLVEEAPDPEGLGGNLTRYALTADGVNFCEKHSLTD